MNPISILLDALSRPCCIECDVPLGPDARTLCTRCDDRLPRWRMADGCPRCGTPKHFDPMRPRDPGEPIFEGCSGCLAAGSALHVCRALARYEGSLRRWLPGFKTAPGPFGPSTPIRTAVDHLAGELAARIARETTSRPDLIVSVPLHRHRRRRRGFNHSDFIAHRIARNLGQTCLPGALERIVDTRAQAELVGRAREANVRGAFRATHLLGEARCVWLVDDVLTTGSTLEAAADALLEAGVLEVRAFTIAATLPRRWTATRRPAYHAPASADRYETSNREHDSIRSLRNPGVQHAQPLRTSRPLDPHRPAYRTSPRSQRR